jgi:hypothetical protein
MCERIVMPDGTVAIVCGGRHGHRRKGGTMTQPQAAPDPPAPREWSPTLKFWLVWQFARTRFLPHKTTDAVWLELLRDAYSGIRHGHATRPTDVDVVHGFNINSPIGEIYAQAARDADEWKAAGAPTTPTEGGTRR